MRGEFGGCPVRMEAPPKTTMSAARRASPAVRTTGGCGRGGKQGQLSGAPALSAPTQGAQSRRPASRWNRGGPSYNLARAFLLQAG